MDLSIKEKSELIDIIEDLNHDIKESESKIEELHDSLGELQNEVCELEYLSESKDTTAEKAYFAGFNSNHSEALKGWLNYKIEAEL